MTLFPPIGSTTAVFGYTADISDGVVPRAEISALPLNPLESPTFASAATSYKGGADTGAELAGGATKIDTNLLKLRDGASDLLAGLIKLRDGAGQLNNGLAGDAVPGSEKLATGAGDLNTGLTQLNSGAKRLAAGTGDALVGSGKLSAGSTKLSNGVSTLNGKLPDLSGGVNDLAGGQKKLAAGLKDLYNAVDNLPATVQSQLATDPDYQRLLGTLDAVVSGIGTPSSTGSDTLMGGLFQVRGGLRTPFTYANNDCIVALGGGTPTKCGVADAAQFMSGLLPAKKADLTCASAVLKDIAGGPDAPLACFGGTRPPGLADETNLTNAFVLNGLSTKLASGATDLDGLVAGLNSIKNGVDLLIIPGINNLRRALYNSPCNPAQTNKAAGDFCGVSQALSLVKGGIPQLVNALTSQLSDQLTAALGQPTAGCDPTATLRCAAAALADGGGQLTTGVQQLVAGVQKLDAGGAQLAAGAGDLSAGLGKLNAGAGQLADGAGTASAGSGQLAAGANKLASGLKTAADGSGQLTAGLATAANGAPQLVNGAQKLSDQGTKKLIAAGTSTAQSYGELYATMTAGAQRAQTDDMAFGAPEGAVGLTAYDYIITGDDGEGGHNLARGLGGLAILGAGGGVFALRRRFI
jgi:putative membrane protein